MTTKRPLTARQRQVLDLWLAGTPYRQLAAALGISPETVNPHLKGVAKKLGATGISREALGVAFSRQVG
jgi:DNA-binding CsgD family transcriptional regulator